MTQNKIEAGFQLLEQSINRLQGALATSFVDAYIENGENMNDDYRVRVLDGLPNDTDKQEIETVYRQFQALDLAPEEKRKISQLLLLQGMSREPLQANHQLTPDSLGFLFVYLIEELVGTEVKSLQLNDLAVGMGNLLLTVCLNLALAGFDVTASGIDVDDTLLTVAAVTSEWLGQPLQLFQQDSLRPSLLAPADFAIADLPIGYYPDDEQAQQFITQTATGHTYAHHLLMEQSMNYVKEAGYGLFLVPSNFLETDQAEELKGWLVEKVYLQAVLQLPANLFKNDASRKSIVVIQNRGAASQQVAEVLLAEVPPLKDSQQVQAFFEQFQAWKLKNLI